MIPAVPGTLANGLTDVALQLGLEPSRTLCIHSTVIDDPMPETASARRQLNAYSRRHLQMLGYMPRNGAPGQARACMFDVEPEVLDYLESAGVLHRKDLVPVGPPPRGTGYPAASVAHHQRLRVEREASEGQAWAPLTLVSSFLGRDEAALAGRSGFSLLMDPRDQVRYQSKGHLRRQALRLGYQVPLGTEVEEEGQLEGRVADLCRRAAAQGLDAGDAWWWVKLDAQSSGAGTFKLQGLDGGSPDRIRAAFAARTKGESGAVPNFPCVVELDVACYPHTRLVANVGVQALLSGPRIVLCGSTLQETTAAGRYIGCKIVEAYKETVNLAERASLPALRGFHEAGYRGPLNLDVLVVEDQVAGQRRGYLIDPNPRFSGGTPLLSLYQHARGSNPDIAHAMMFFNLIPRGPEPLAGRVAGLCGKDLFLGLASDFLGILPLVIPDPGHGGGDDAVVTVLVFGRDEDHAWQQYNRFKSRIQVARSGLAL